MFTKDDIVLLGPSAHAFVVHVLRLNGLDVQTPSIFGTYVQPIEEGALVKLPFPACAPKYAESDDDYMWAFTLEEIYRLTAEGHSPWTLNDYVRYDYEAEAINDIAEAVFDPVDVLTHAVNRPLEFINLELTNRPADPNAVFMRPAPEAMIQFATFQHIGLGVTEAPATPAEERV